MGVTFKLFVINFSLLVDGLTSLTSSLDEEREVKSVLYCIPVRDIGGCATWTQFVNTNSLFATFAPGRNSVQQCQDFCLGFQGCVAIDFDHTGSDTQGCWYHTDRTDLNERFDTLNVDQYVFSTECMSCSFTGIREKVMLSV